MKELPLPKFKVIDPVQSSDFSKEMLPCVEATTLGLQRYQLIGRKGSLSVILTQGKNPVTGKEEPALVLANQRDPKARHVYLLLSQLYQMVVPEVMSQVAPKLAERLFGFVTRNDLFLISDAIFEFAEDLQKAKPARQLGTQDWLSAIAQDGFTIRRNGEAVN